MEQTRTYNVYESHQALEYADKVVVTAGNEKEDYEESVRKH